MAREWALAGVTEEELKPEQPIGAPRKPKGKWENFWYHYKWTALLITACVGILTIFIWQLLNRDDPDYHVVLVTDHAISSVNCTYWEQLLMPYGTDVDGDGKVEVLVENVYLSTEMAMNQTVVANATKLTSYLASRDVALFVMEPTYYEERIRSHLEEGERFFAPLKTEAVLAEEGSLWNWNGSELQQKVAEKMTVPKDLYFGVRLPAEGASQKERARSEQGAVFLEALVAAMQANPS